MVHFYGTDYRAHTVITPLPDLPACADVYRRVVSVKHRSTKEHCIDRRRRRRTGTTINIRTTRRLLYNIPHTSKMPTMSTTTTRTSRLSSHRCRKLPLLHLPSQDSSSHQVQSMFSISW